jgi:hypothetical protein
MKNNKIKLKEQSGITGKVTIIGTKSGAEVYRKTYNNLVVSGSGGYGKNIIARLLASDNTYTGNITHADLGNGSTPPTLASTLLNNAIARTSVAGNQTVNNNEVTLQFFFSDLLLPDGTYTEFGTFIDGTSAVNTGRLFNMLIFSDPYEKTTGVDTTIEVILTIN